MVTEPSNSPSRSDPRDSGTRCRNENFILKKYHSMLDLDDFSMLRAQFDIPPKFDPKLSSSTGRICNPPSSWLALYEDVARIESSLVDHRSRKQQQG